jgi:hypothetical protein
MSFKKLPDKIWNAVKEDKKAALILFLTAIILRLLPELLIPTYPVGYETITYYAPAMIQPDPISTNPYLNLVHHIQFISAHQPLADTFRSGPLFYIIIWLAADLSGANSFLSLKATAPLFYGCLALSFFIFTRRGLNLEPKIAFLATMILIFQPAALRESWDRYRTVLALIFFFATLTLMTKPRSNRKYIATATLGILTVLSREYVGLVLLITIAGYAIFEKKNRLASFITIAPAIITFLAMFNKVWLDVNYLSPDSTFYLASYGVAVLDSLAIFAANYILLLPFILKGFRKNHLLNPMTGWLLLGSFSFVLLPWFAIPGYQRWIMLLVYPFCIYSTWGLLRLNLGKHRKKIIVAVLLTFMAIGTAYSTGAFSFIIPNSYIPTSYIPSSLVQSSIPWNEIDAVKNVTGWLQKHAEAKTALLSEERFYGWSMINLKPQNDNITVLAYGANSLPDSALKEAIDNNCSQIYLIWYRASSPLNFNLTYSNQDIAIFKYAP